MNATIPHQVLRILELSRLQLFIFVDGLRRMRRLTSEHYHLPRMKQNACVECLSIGVQESARPGGFWFFTVNNNINNTFLFNIQSDKPQNVYK